MECWKYSDGFKREILGMAAQGEAGQRNPPPEKQTSAANESAGCSDWLQSVSTAWIRTRNRSVNSRLLCR